MYRMMIGSRRSHIGWDDFNVDIVDFLSGGPFENQPAQMKLCKEQWDSDLSTEIEIASKKEKQVTYRNPSGPMGRFVTECEAIAAADPVYRARFSSEFHRRDPHHVETPGSKRKILQHTRLSPRALPTKPISANQDQQAYH
ncbi:hypothetical protein D6D27_04781 [Aureobasidium pullulans]|nr:hypothetical protein D6D27_04781 [Aureobasidium pullulans]